MSLYAQFKTDPDLEKNGVEIDYGDFRVTLARAGGANKSYNKKMDQLAKPFKRQIATETIDTEVAERLVREAFASTVVRRWETLVEGEWKVGIEDPDGGDLLPMTVDNLVATFTNLPEIFTEIQEQAGKAAIYRAEALETDSGN